ncbi:putative quinol monooxygenase [Novosphingobium sp. Gsoil 351]|uniref:putative quinol monooxygenase n=1 Tax=Novosphingobium sp. Gsoil 351 TaxID=2675225 RepID=UPI0012B499EA|nr:antibiotic biosynthesis monooxygenase [Novosphingobium sp. Gsoil 351]QGN55684.1 hypothetical protein GKE62_15155 [Novosphingobium sp. Gsoil 351]
MATALIRMRIKQGETVAFEAMARALYDQSHHCERALLRYEYWRGQEPGTYYCLQAFADYAGFLTYETAPYHEAAAAPIMALIADFDLQWVDPVAGAAPLNPSLEQLLASGSGDRETFYAGLFPLKRAAWWPATARSEQP